MYQIGLPRPHPKQEQVKSEAVRFNVVDCGRRFGKTLLGEDVLLGPAALHYQPVAWFAPTYKYLADAWRDLVRLVGPAITDHSKTEHHMRLSGGGIIDGWTMHEAPGRGRKYARIVVDEAALEAELMAKWLADIRPTLSDLQGDAWFLSTPKGRNGFWQMYQWGLDPQRDEWRCWQFPTSSNPYIAKEEIEAARRDLPERIFRQEYLAEFLEDAGGVFRRVMAAAVLTEQREPMVGHQYVFGVDWGKSADFTAIAVWDMTDKHLVYLDRFNQIGYGFQTKRLKALYNRWQPTVMVCEANSMGQPLIDQLRDEGYRVRGFTTTAVTKTQIIESLSLAFERGDIEIINDPVLVGELQAYEMTRLPSGNFRYSAPEGMHDDTVMAAAIGYHGIDRFVPRHAGSFQG